jgi:putative salt-induced outer membrane protein YdiY
MGSVCVCFGLLFASSLSARTDIVMLTSGERIMGEVLPQSNETTLVLKSALLGEISLPRSRVVRIEAFQSPESQVAQPTAVAVVEPVAAPPTPAASEVAATPAPVKAVATPTPVKAVVAATQPTEAEVKAAEMVEMAAIEQEEVDIYERILGFTAPDSWNGNVRMGMNISTGDKQWTETALRGNLEIKEKGSRNFYRLTGSYTYRETEKSNGDKYKSTDRYDATFTYRRSFDQDWFFQNALGGRVDQVKGIDHEFQDTVGIGYKLRPIEKFEVLFGGGGGIEDYQTTFDDTREGVNAVMNVFQELTWHPFSRTSVIQKFNYYWNPEATEQYNYVLSAAVRVRLTDLLGFEFSFNQNYDNDIGNGNPKDDAIWRNALVVYF